MSLRDKLLEIPVIYRAWQLPFAEQKLAPLQRRGDMLRARRVLDVGCGPGTNAKHFSHTEYLGIDHNPAYVAAATRRYGRRFVAADVTTYSAESEGRFDFILVNSLLHHLDTPDVSRLLRHLATLLTDGGHIHILELVVPANRFSASAMLARADRGKYPRPLGEWRALFAECVDVEDFEPYGLGTAGLTLWSMVYCRARSRTGASNPLR